MTEQAHAEFETWWNRQPHREQFEDVKDQMRNVWVAGWIESRRKAVIKLPAKPDADTFTQVQSAYWQGIEIVAAQAEAAGLTVR